MCDEKRKWFKRFAYGSAAARLGMWGAIWLFLVVYGVATQDAWMELMAAFFAIFATFYAFVLAMLGWAMEKLNSSGANKKGRKR